MSLDIWSKDTGGNYSDNLGYFVGGSRYGAFFGAPFYNGRNCTIILKSLTLPLAYWSESGVTRTVQGAVWLASRGPIGGSANVMDLYSAAVSNLSVLRTRNSGNVKGSDGYNYWYSPWEGLGANDRERVLSAMLYSTNTCTPSESVDRDTQTRASEYTFYFNDIQIPSGTYFYVGIYGSESVCEGTSIAIRRLGYSSTNRNGSSDQKYHYERNTLVAANYENDYRGRWHFYNGYFTSSSHPNNYAQGVVDARIMVVSPFSTPTISITSSEIASKCESPTTIFYSQNTASGNQGNTYVQYSVNYSNWETVSGSSNSAGSFSYTPSSYGIGRGVNYIVRVRRVCSSADFDNVSEIDSVDMHTYKNVTMTGFSIAPADIVNANTNTELTWDSSNDDEYDPTTCSIDIFIGNTLISTIDSYLENNIVSKEFIPSNYIDMSYDNVSVIIRITRTGAISGYESSQDIIFKVLYRPIGKVYNITPENLGIISDDDETISWAYPTLEYTGIVSGYNITLTSVKGHVVNYNVATNSCTIITNNLNPSVYYKIGIRPYYQSDGNKYYGSYTEISNYLYYDKGIAKPVITYPRNSKWAGNTYRVVFDLPEDYNYEYFDQGTKNAYRYHDVEVNINNIPYKISQYPEAYSLTQNNLTHKATIVFSPSIIGVQSQSTNIIKVRAESYFDNWSDYSNSITIEDCKEVLEKISSSYPNGVIYYSDCSKIFNLCKYACTAYEVSITFSGLEDIIRSTDINNVTIGITEVISTVNSNTFDNNSVKFRELTDGLVVSVNDIIELSHFEKLIAILRDIYY